MFAPIESARGPRWWRSPLVARMALAGAFVLLLCASIYTTGDRAHVIASLAAFATAITWFGASMISWERVVASARSAGLVEHTD